jgi:hypothetical protein
MYGVEILKEANMKKYAKIIDEQTKEVQIGVGVNDEYYKEIGMTLMDVEQAYNSNWYVEGYAPKYEPAEDELKQRVRSVRNGYLKDTDFTQLNDAPFTSEEKLQYAQYRQYLRDYTEGENWWLSNPKTFEEWK